MGRAAVDEVDQEIDGARDALLDGEGEGGQHRAEIVGAVAVVEAITEICSGILTPV